MLIGKCKNCNKEFKYFRSNESGKYCSWKCWTKNQKRVKNSFGWGSKHTNETKLKMSIARKGKKQTPEWAKKHGDGLVKYWDKRGRKSDITQQIKTGRRYKLWRKLIFERDKFSCVVCGDNRGGNLEVDHIIPFSLLVEEFKMGLIDINHFFYLDSGRTLCRKCHMKTKNWGYKFRNAPEWQMFNKLRFLYNLTNKELSFTEFYDKSMTKIIQNADTIVSVL